MPSLLVSAAVALLSQPATVPEVGEAAAAAARCDLLAYERAVGRLEDRALQSVRAAHEAVARAAAAGDVRTAGDAEWGAYKELMGAAHEARVANLEALAVCRARAPKEEGGGAAAKLAETAGAAGAAGNAETSSAGASRGGGETSSASPPRRRVVAPPRLRLSLAETYVDHRFGAANEVPVVRQSGLYAFTSPSPTAPVAFPGGSFSGTEAVPTGESTPLTVRAWENEHRLKLEFAPGGFAAPGWRISGETGLSTGAVKEQLRSVLTAAPPEIDLAATPQVTCLFVSSFTGRCVTWRLAVPFTREVFQIPGAFNSPFQTEVSTYDVNQANKRFFAGAGLARSFVAPTPLGELEMSLGARATASWRTFEEVRTIAAVQGTPGTGFVAVYPVRGEGPGFGGGATASVEGRLVRDLLRWRLFGELGAEWVQLDLHTRTGASTVLDGDRTTWRVGGEVNLRLSSSARLALTAEQRRGVHVSTAFSPSGGDGVLLNDGSAVHVDLRSATAWAYGVTLTYDF